MPVPFQPQRAINPRLASPQVGGCCLWFNGSFYDNLLVGRRGVTSLNWPKPKVKIDSKQGQVRPRQGVRWRGGAEG